MYRYVAVQIAQSSNPGWINHYANAEYVQFWYLASIGFDAVTADKERSNKLELDCLNVLAGLLLRAGIFRHEPLPRLPPPQRKWDKRNVTFFPRCEKWHFSKPPRQRVFRKNKRRFSGSGSSSNSLSTLVFSLVESSFVWRRSHRALWAFQSIKETGLAGGYVSTSIGMVRHEI